MVNLYCKLPRKQYVYPTQIAKILKEFDNGKSAEEITREHGVSKASLYKWRQRYGGMEATELKRIKKKTMASIHTTI